MYYGSVQGTQRLLEVKSCRFRARCGTRTCKVSGKDWSIEAAKSGPTMVDKKWLSSLEIQRTDLSVLPVYDTCDSCWSQGIDDYVAGVQIVVPDIWFAQGFVSGKKMMTKLGVNLDSF